MATYSYYRFSRTISNPHAPVFEFDHLDCTDEQFRVHRRHVELECVIDGAADVLRALREPSRPPRRARARGAARAVLRRRPLLSVRRPPRAGHAAGYACKEGVM